MSFLSRANRNRSPKVSNASTSTNNYIQIALFENKYLNKVEKHIDFSVSEHYNKLTVSQILRKNERRICQ